MSRKKGRGFLVLPYHAIFIYFLSLIMIKPFNYFLENNYLRDYDD